MLQVPPGEGGGGANLIDIEEGQNKTQVFTSYKEIKYKTSISLVFVVSLPPLESNTCFPCFQLMLEEEQNLEYLQERERSVAQLEADIGDVNQIFKDLAAMVHDQVMMRSLKKKNQVFFYQGEMVDSIEANVESASIRVNEGSDQLRMAERYQVRFGEQSCHLLNLCLSCEPAFQVFYLPFISNLL